MNGRQGFGRWAAGFLVLAVCVTGCGGVHQVEPVGKPPAAVAEPDPWSLYNAAIFESAVFEPEEQVVDLATVDGPVTVVSFKRCECSTCIPCLELGEQDLAREIWVTVVPEVEKLCQGVPADGLVLFLQQLLGLPPTDTALEDTYFLEMRVEEPAAIFRPCTNPDPAAPGPCTETFPEDVHRDHIVWMAEQMLSSWQVPDGYPWTRLGYTYNWNPAAASIVGPSELLVRKGAEVEVLRVVPAAEYCGTGG